MCMSGTKEGCIPMLASASAALGVDEAAIAALLKASEM